MTTVEHWFQETYAFDHSSAHLVEEADALRHARQCVQIGLEEAGTLLLDTCVITINDEYHDAGKHNTAGQQTRCQLKQVAGTHTNHFREQQHGKVGPSVGGDLLIHQVSNQV